MRDAAPITQTYGKARFLALLVAAELNAQTAWECEFTDDLRTRFEKHGEHMVMTPLQRKHLKRIARED